MPDTTFVAKQTVITAAWANDVNDAVYQGIGTGLNGFAPTTHQAVLNNLGLTSIVVPTGASLIGLIGPVTSMMNVQQYVDALSGPDGASYIGARGSGDLGQDTVQGQILELNAEKASLLHYNKWINRETDIDAQPTVMDGEQYLNYTHPAMATSTPVRNWGGWTAFIHSDPNSASDDNLTALTGHCYWDSKVHNSPGGLWGVVTEAWSNDDRYATLIGGELAVISMCPSHDNFSVGVDLVFKNRLDGALRPSSPQYGLTMYNRKSLACFISSQTRPTDPLYADAGSGWNTAIKIGDQDGGSGLDREGGSGTGVGGDQWYKHKEQGTILDLTNCLTDMNGGTPWFALFRNGGTYWGMRFKGSVVGALDTHNLVVSNGGVGYAIGDKGTISTGSGTASYQVLDVLAESVRFVAVIYGGGSYAVANGVNTTRTTGNGSGLQLNIVLGTGIVYGGECGPFSTGTGYKEGDLLWINGAATGRWPAMLKVTKLLNHPIGYLGTGGVEFFEILSNDATVRGQPRKYPISGYTAGQKSLTAYSTNGTGFDIFIQLVHDEPMVGGERWEYWRMQNPNNPTGSGLRQGYIDASFPGITKTIDTSQATYSFPKDGPFR